MMVIICESWKNGKEATSPILSRRAFEHAEDVVFTVASVLLVH